jgi:hypothetical protein
VPFALKTNAACLGLGLAGLIVGLAAARPAQAHNAACWGRGRDDVTRPDIVCPSLIEAFVMSLKGATRTDVVRAMNGPGVTRGNPDALHFTSNHDYGHSGYRGDINFLFRGDTVVQITALAQDVNIEPDYEYIWIDGEGECSDYPGSQLGPCRGPNASDEAEKLSKDLAAMLGH